MSGLNIYPQTASINNSTSIVGLSSNMVAMTSNLAAFSTRMDEAIGTSDAVSSTGDSLHGKVRWLIANRSVIKSIQRGTVTFTSTAASTSVAITEVVSTNSMLNNLGFIYPSSGTDWREMFTYLSLSSNAVNITRGLSAGSTLIRPTVSFEVIEYW